MEAKKVFVLGGDIRSLYIAEYFACKGCEVTGYGLGKPGESLDKLEKADITVMGLPAIKNGYVNMPLSDEKLTFEEVLTKCLRKSLVFGGRFKEEEYALAKKAGVILQDYSEDEVFKTENALYTAEGIVKYLVENTEKSVRDLNILVTGCGRISRSLCNLLVSWPCRVWVYARKELSRTQCKLQGFEPLSNLKEMSPYDVIINTIPADIFTEDIISSVKKDAVIFDVSERPGFVKKDLCNAYGVRLLYLPGIPLTSAPQSAGITAAKAIERFSLNPQH